MASPYDHNLSVLRYKKKIRARSVDYYRGARSEETLYSAPVEVGRAAGGRGLKSAMAGRCWSRDTSDTIQDMPSLDEGLCLWLVMWLRGAGTWGCGFTHRIIASCLTLSIGSSRSGPHICALPLCLCPDKLTASPAAHAGGDTQQILGRSN